MCISLISLTLPCSKTQRKQTTCSLITRIAAVFIGIVAMLIGALILCKIPGLLTLGTTGGWLFCITGFIAVLAGTFLQRTKGNQVSPNNCPQAFPTTSYEPNNKIKPAEYSADGKKNQKQAIDRKNFQYQDLIGTFGITHKEHAPQHRYHKVKERLVEKFKTKNFEELSNHIYGAGVSFNMYSKSAEETNWNEEYVVETISLYFLSDEEMLRLPLKQIALFDHNQKERLQQRITIPLRYKYLNQIRDGQNPYTSQGDGTLGELLFNTSVSDLQNSEKILLRLQSLENELC